MWLIPVLIALLVVAYVVRRRRRKLPPGPVRNFHATVGDDMKVLLEWNDPAVGPKQRPLAGILIESQVKDSGLPFDVQGVAQPGAESLLLEGVAVGTYVYRATPRDDKGNSGPAVEIEVEVAEEILPPGPVTGFVATVQPD